MNLIILAMIFAVILAMHEATKKDPSLNSHKWKIGLAFPVQMAASVWFVAAVLLRFTWVGAACALVAVAGSAIGCGLAVWGVPWRRRAPACFYVSALAAIGLNGLELLASAFVFGFAVYQVA